MIVGRAPNPSRRPGKSQKMSKEASAQRTSSHMRARLPQQPGALETQSLVDLRSRGPAQVKRRVGRIGTQEQSVEQARPDGDHGVRLCLAAVACTLFVVALSHWLFPMVLRARLAKRTARRMRPSYPFHCLGLPSRRLCAPYRLSYSIGFIFCMPLLHGRAGRLTDKIGGFRKPPGTGQTC